MYKLTFKKYFIFLVYYCR